MRKLAIAVSAVALLSVGLTAASLRVARAEVAGTPAPVASHAAPAPAAPQTAAAAPAARKDATAAANQLVQDYCVGCHDDAQKTGDVTLEHFDLKTVDPVIAGKMLTKLGAGQMPPPGLPRPDDATLKAFEQMLQARATGLAMSDEAGAKLAASHGPMVAKVVAFPHTGDQMTLDAQNAMVHQICTHCHNDKMKTGGLTLDHFDAAQAPQHAEVAEMMLHKLRVGMMPPSTAPERPDAATVHAFVKTLEGEIDRAATLKTNPGWRPFQRMNRAEYSQAVHDLLDLDVDVDQYLPPDTISASFDNVADVQGFSPTLMDGYLRAASDISRLAVGDLHASAGSITYKLGRTLSQMNHVEGAPMGTRGGLSVIHIFPADGDYVFKASMHYEPLGHIFGAIPMITMGLKEQIDVSIDGRRVGLLELNPQMSETDLKNGLVVATPPIHVKAGPHRLSAAFVSQMDAPIDDLLEPLGDSLADVSNTFGITNLPHMRDFTVVGPSKVTGVSDTPSRRRIFICRPLSPDQEMPCATKIVSALATAAYRGQVEPADLKALMGLYAQGRKSGGFEDGVRLALQGILANPNFLFRVEDLPTTVRAGQPYKLDGLELASRLSFFLWGSLPDAQLVKVARSGQLTNPVVLDREVHRMLKDPKSETLSTRFAAQWLRLQDLDKIHPDYLQYPMYDDSLAQAMKHETELFFDSIVKEDHSVLDLLTADYSYVNQRLARHYGIPNVVGDQFRKVTLPPYRRGLLGQGSILTLTSVADRTSPVQRGKWVMEVILGTPPPPPPPNVPPLDDSVKGTQGGRMLSTRERMEQHRANPACNSCHRVIDPLGLALDNFDVTGAWRIKDNEVPVDAAGELYDGTKITGPADLRNALLKHQDVFLRTFTRNLMTYALGRRVEYYDMPTIRSIVRQAGKNDNRFSSYVLGIINSPAFREGQLSSSQLTTTTAERQR
ncbi:MAG: DUF1592 domain-containing protein [Acidobacteriota bacterium]|nr:DUF1592 domain-containing protein [Acidobacteriota bacterium]